MYVYLLFCELSGGLVSTWNPHWLENQQNLVELIEDDKASAFNPLRVCVCVILQSLQKYANRRLPYLFLPPHIGWNTPHVWPTPHIPHTA